MSDVLKDKLIANGFNAYHDKEFIKHLKAFVNKKEPSPRQLSEHGLIMPVPNKTTLNQLQHLLVQLTIFYKTAGHLEIPDDDFIFLSTKAEIDTLKKESPLIHNALMVVAKLSIKPNTERDHTTATRSPGTAKKKKRKTAKSLMRYVKDPIWKHNFLKMEHHMKTEDGLEALTLTSQANLIWMDKQTLAAGKGQLNEHQELLLRKIGAI